MLIILLFISRFYVSKYTYIKGANDSLIYLNPFQPQEYDFENLYAAANKKLKKGDSLNARKDFEEALEFHGTYNEKQREQIYSDANDLWEYKLDKLLKYSKAYEFIGNLDSAMSCLSPGLTSHEKWHYPIDERFFELAVKKYGKIKTRELIMKGLERTGKPDCYHCNDYFFEFGKFKVGIDENEFELITTNKNKLAEELYEKYGI